MSRWGPPKYTANTLPSMIHKDIETGCWLWTQGINAEGYGDLVWDGRGARAHRVFYQLYRGPIPSGLTLDHICRVRHCVNPDHLRPLSNRDNILAGVSPVAVNASKRCCLRGHDDWVVLPGKFGRTRRECLTCRKIRDKMKALLGTRKRYPHRKGGPPRLIPGAWRRP